MSSGEVIAFTAVIQRGARITAVLTRRSAFAGVLLTAQAVTAALTRRVGFGAQL